MQPESRNTAFNEHSKTNGDAKDHQILDLRYGKASDSAMGVKQALGCVQRWSTCKELAVVQDFVVYAEQCGCGVQQSSVVVVCSRAVCLWCAAEQCVCGVQQSSVFVVCSRL